MTPVPSESGSPARQTRSTNPSILGHSAKPESAGLRFARRGILPFAILAFLGVGLPSCGGGSAAASVLDEMDKVVSVLESQQSLTRTPDQMNQLNKANIDFLVKVQEFTESGGQMTPDEMKRLSDISTRYTKILQKLTP